MDRRRLALLLALSVPLLVGVSHRIGFERSFGWRDDLRDAFLALGIGIVGGAVVLVAFGVIKAGMPADESRRQGGDPGGSGGARRAPRAQPVRGVGDDEDAGSRRSEALSGYAGRSF